jgi:hypothetical protein
MAGKRIAQNNDRRKKAENLPEAGAPAQDQRGAKGNQTNHQTTNL